ncbi:ribose 5-phosphate isomerase B [Nocardioides sp. GXQ0305]|uniref:ribose 5-phosphate isomerase B n=1 Tax=Nocardioides sp. GXQ0305 TaxID=3423912 RepID=UPI003D7DE4FB
MRLALGNDHAGLGLKPHVLRLLADLGHEVVDVGTDTEEPVDFPDVTRDVCRPVLAGEADRGILLCGTGVGASIAANKVPGIRAALCHDSYCAHQGVEHDDVNVLCLGAWIVGPLIAEDVIRSFLGATFSTDPDFRRRVEKLHAMERAAAGQGDEA